MSNWAKKYWFKSLLLAIAVLMVGLLPMLVMNSDANTGEPEMEPLTGYAWQKVCSATEPVFGLFAIGDGKMISSSHSESFLVDMEAQTEKDFGYHVISVYKVSDDDFFFVELDGDDQCHIRRSINGDISDRMISDIDFGGWITLAGEGNDVYAFGSRLMHFDLTSGQWNEIPIDESLPEAFFYLGECTSNYLYLSYGRTDDETAVLYRYDRINKMWQDISPDESELLGFTGIPIIKLWVSDDDSLIYVNFDHEINKVYRYKDGNWGYEFTPDFYAYNSGTCVRNNPVIGSGVLITNSGYYYFNDGSKWVTFDKPTGFGDNAEYYRISSYVCADSDGSIYSWVGDNTSLSGIYKLSKMAEGDQTPPVITTTASDCTVTHSSYTFTVKAEDEVDGPVVPTVKLGGESGTVLTGTAQGDGSYSYTATLAEGANTIYIEAADESGNKATATYTITYAADNTPPVFDTGYPKTANHTTTGFDLLLKLNEPGTAYYLVVADGADPGSDYASWTAVTIPDTEEVSASISGLIPGKAYNVYVIAKDTAGNMQAAPVRMDVTTETNEPEMEPLTGYAWQKISNNGAVALYSIGSGKVLFAKGHTANADIVDTNTETTIDFGYAVYSAYVVSEGDFFFSEYVESERAFYLRRFTEGVVSDRMNCEILRPYGVTGRGDDLYAFGTGLAKYDAASNTWKKVDLDSSLPDAVFFQGECTSKFMYFAGMDDSRNSVLYRYNMTAGTWENISPNELTPQPTGKPTLCVTEDDSQVMASFQGPDRGNVFSYINGQWNYEFHADEIEYNSGVAVKNNPVIGSGILIANGGFYYFNDGQKWWTLDRPSGFGYEANYYHVTSNILADSDGNIYSCVSDGTELSGMYKLSKMAEGDETPPVITTSASDCTVNDSSYTFTVKAEDEVDGTVVPTVKLGGESGTVLTGTDQGDDSYSYTATLAEGANTIYIKAADESGNTATATYTITYAADTTPPAFDTGYPKTANLTATGLDLLLKLNEPGTACYQVVADGAEPGSDYADWTAVTIPDTEEVSAPISGLAPGTAYNVYIIAKDTAGNMQAAPVRLDVTTAGESPEGFSIERLGEGGFELGSDANVTVRMTNNTGASQQATLIICLYDNTNNSMERYSYVSREVLAGEQLTMSGGFTIPSSGSYSIKAFVWDTFENMESLLKDPLVMEVN